MLKEYFMQMWKWPPIPRSSCEDPPEEQLRLLQKAAPELGLLHPRTCTPHHGHCATQPTFQELETTAGGRGHLPIRSHQVLQAMLWAPAYRCHNSLIFPRQ